MSSRALQRAASGTNCIARASKRPLPSAHDRYPQAVFLPFQTRKIHETPQIVDGENEPLSPYLRPRKPRDASQVLSSRSSTLSTPGKDFLGRPAHSPRYDTFRAPASTPTPTDEPLRISPTLREKIPFLVAQPPHYITIHIHGKPYLVTVGDKVRLPFLMHGVMPGDVLRLNRASTLGSREYVMRGGSHSGAPTPSISQTGPTASQASGEVPVETQDLTTAQPIIGKKDDAELSPPYPASSNPTSPETGRTAGLKQRGPVAYLDERLFVCRAVVMGTESEPMRVKEKTKQRTRYVRHVRSKHKYTVLAISEVKVHDLPHLDAAAQQQASEAKESRPRSRNTVSAKQTIEKGNEAGEKSSVAETIEESREILAPGGEQSPISTQKSEAKGKSGAAGVIEESREILNTEAERPAKKEKAKKAASKK